MQTIAGACRTVSSLASRSGTTATVRRNTSAAPTACRRRHLSTRAADRPKTHATFTRKSVVAMAGKEVHLAAEGVAPFNGPVAAAGTRVV